MDIIFHFNVIKLASIALFCKLDKPDADEKLRLMLWAVARRPHQMTKG
jgi:hypothetical protein